VVGAACVGVGSDLAHGLVPFVSEAARCFLPVGETGVCKRKEGSQGSETQRNCRIRKFRLSFWVEALLECAEGLAPKQSNEQHRAAMKSRVRTVFSLSSLARDGSFRYLA
jgi:hypothetical protein